MPMLLYGTSEARASWWLAQLASWGKVPLQDSSSTLQGCAVCLHNARLIISVGVLAAFSSLRVRSACGEDTEGSTGCQETLPPYSSCRCRICNAEGRDWGQNKIFLFLLPSQFLMLYPMIQSQLFSMTCKYVSETISAYKDGGMKIVTRVWIFEICKIDVLYLWFTIVLVHIPTKSCSRNINTKLLKRWYLHTIKQTRVLCTLITSEEQNVPSDPTLTWLVVQ